MTVESKPTPKVRRWVEEAERDILYAIRQHRRAPGFAVLIVLTLAIGIGANVTMAGAVDRLLLRAPHHVRDPDRVVRLLLTTRNLQGAEFVSARSNYPTFLDFAREVPAAEAVGAHAGAMVSIGQGPDAVEARASLVSASFFAVYGVTAHIGRVFLPSDDSTSNSAAIAVLGHGFWRRHYGSDSAVIGRTVRIGGFPYHVVGVAPLGFTGLESEPPEIWLPIAVAAEREARIPLSLEDRGSAWLSMVARLRDGASRELLSQQASAVWHEHNQRATGRESRRIIAASVIPGRGPDRPREVKVTLWLGGVSVLVLLIACANVSNLLLARAFARRREIAVRLAMGAGRARLARQLLAEGVVIAVVSGAAALLVASLGGRLVQRWLLTQAAGADGGFVDLRLLAIDAVVALGVGVAISLAPLLQSTVPDLSRSLNAGPATGGGRLSRVRMVLLGAQAGLCMALLIGAGLFASSLRRVKALDLGLDIERTLMARVDLGRTLLPRAEVEATYAAMVQRVRRLDGVAYAALAQRDPYMYGRAVPAHTPARSEESLWHRDDASHVPMEVAVDSMFFRAVGATSLRGRDFESTDRHGAPRVAIINEALARLLWPGEDALGQCMFLTFEGDECVTVVGVLGGFWKNSILERDRLVVYVPLAQADTYIRAGSMFVAARTDPTALVPQIRRAIQSVRPDLPAVSVLRMRDVLGAQFRPWELAAAMFAVFAAIALIIAVVGLYGVVAFTAVQRAPETAIRVALGAQPRHVLALVAGEGLRVVLVGLTVGALAVLAVRRWIGALLFQTSPSDPAIILAVGVVLLSVALVASLIPTLRVLRRSPAAVLRLE